MKNNINPEDDLRRILLDVLSDIWQDKEKIARVYLADLYSAASVNAISNMIDEKISQAKQDIIHALMSS